MTRSTEQLGGRRYLPAALVLLALTLVLASQPVSSAFQYKVLNLLGPILDAAPHASPLYGGASLVILGGLALFVYIRHLDPFAAVRPRLAVFFNVLAVSLYVGLALFAWDYGQAQEAGLTSYAIAPVAALLPPILVLLGESLLRRINLRLGRAAGERGWRGAALRQLRLCLALQPADTELRRQCGLLYVAEDECDHALPMLEPLGPIETSTDEDILRALEQCHRTRGDVERALTCLLRLRELNPEQANIDRHILEDYVKLGMTAEAIALLESDRLKPTMDQELLLQRLYLERRDYDKALQQIRGIAALEGAPYAQTIRLYQDLSQRQPDRLEIRVSLGQLLLGDPNSQRRQQGVALLEDALQREPKQLHLSRALVRHYQETNNLPRLREHLYRLVAAGEPDASFYLDYAQILLDEQKLADAEAVLERLTQALPGDWRGHLRLARLRFQLGETEQAEVGLLTAEQAAVQAGDAEAEPLIRHLRYDLDQRRRKAQVLTMTEQIKTNPAGEVDQGAQRLELIGHLIEVERVDQALQESDRLLAEKPALRPEVERRIRQGIEKIERNYRLRDYLADLCFEQGRYEETLQLYREMAEQSLHPAQVMAEGCRKILRRAPDYLEARRELALAEREAGQWAAVTEALDPVLARDVETPPEGESATDGGRLTDEDKALWVEAAFRQGRLVDAARVGLPLVDALAAETGFMLMMIDILLGAGEFDQALAVYHLARKTEPDNDRLKRVERKVTGARTRFRMDQLLARQKEGDLSPAEHLEKAELHHELGQSDEAIIHLQRAADDERLEHLALAKMAVVLCERGMYDLADETLDPLILTREMVLEFPQIKDHYYTVARAMEKIRQPNLAVKYFKRIFRVDAAYADIVQRLERYT